MIEIVDVEQGTEAWYRARAGLVTASEFDKVLAKPRKGETVSKTRQSYMRQLAAELITGEPSETYVSAAMERGKQMEAEARKAYAFAAEAEPQLVGFVRNGDKGCSPDAFLGDIGLLEIKTKRGDILIDVLLRDTFPAEHRAQCQGALWVTEREWIDLCCYWPLMPMYVRREYRDEAYIRQLAGEVARFSDELQALVARVRAYGH